MVAKAKPAKPVEAKLKVAAPTAAWPFPTATPRPVTARRASSTPKVAPVSKAKASPARVKTPVVATNKPVHAVKATLTNFELAKAKSALTLDLFANSSKLGTLEVGSGAFYWTGKSRQKSKRIDWSKFSEMMNKLAYPNG